MTQNFNRGAWVAQTENKIKGELGQSKCGICVAVRPFYNMRKPAPSSFSIILVNPGNQGAPAQGWNVNAAPITGDLRAEGLPYSRYSNKNGSEPVN